MLPSVATCFALGICAITGYASDLPKLEVEFAGLDFGNVPRHAQRERIVQVRNPGSDAVTIRGTSADCICLDAKVEPGSLAPGGDMALRIQLETCDYVGQVRRQVWIEGERGERLALIPVRYHVVPELFVEPEYIAFGWLNDDVVSARLEVRTLQDAPFHIMDIRCDEPSCTAVIEKTLVTRDRPGLVRLELDPAGCEHPLRGSLLIQTDSSDTPQLRVPLHAETATRLRCESREIVFDDRALGQNATTRVRFQVPEGAQVREIRTTSEEVSVAGVERDGRQVAVTLRRGERVPLGAFRGQLRVETLDGTLRTLSLPYRGRVVEPAGWLPRKPGSAAPAAECCK